MPRPLPVPEEEILGMRSGHRRAQALGFLAGEDRRVVELPVGDAVQVEEGVDIEHAMKYENRAYSL